MSIYNGEPKILSNRKWHKTLTFKLSFESVFKQRTENVERQQHLRGNLEKIYIVLCSLVYSVFSRKLHWTSRREFKILGIVFQKLESELNDEASTFVNSPLFSTVDPRT